MQELRSEAGKTVEDMDEDENFPDPADRASMESNRNSMLRIRDRERKLIFKIQEAVDAGIQEIIFVTGRGKDGIEDHFDEAPELEQVLTERGQTELVEMLRRIKEMTEVVSVRQKKPLGLGHAVLCARDLVGDEPFAVMLADDLIDSEILGI